jgi:hypothetical protein
MEAMSMHSKVDDAAPVTTDRPILDDPGSSDPGDATCRTSGVRAEPGVGPAQEADDPPVPSELVQRVTRNMLLLVDIHKRLRELDPVDRGRIVDGLNRTYAADVKLYGERALAALRAIAEWPDEPECDEDVDGPGEP